MQDIMTFVSHHVALSAAVVIILILLVMIEMIRLKRQGTRLTPAQATQLINRDNAIVIDMRGPEAYKKGHIINAHAISLSDIKTNKKKIEKFKTKPIIMVCQNGIESPKITTQLKKEGYNASALAGGMRAWLDADMPIVKE